MEGSLLQLIKLINKIKIKYFFVFLFVPRNFVFSFRLTLLTLRLLLFVPFSNGNIEIFSVLFLRD